MANGGIIGTVNNPTSSTATGVWQQEEQYEAVRDGTWPSRPLFTTKSLRFNSGSADHLDKTFGQAGNKKTFTVSFWIKTTVKETYNAIFDAGQDGSNSDDIYFHTGRLNFSGYYGSTQFALRTTAKFRDAGAWSHHVIAFDTTQGTASNRIKFFTNGVQETAFDDATYPSQNFQTSYMNTARLHNIGTLVNGDNFALDGYLSEFVFIDGQALAPTSFGVANSDGVWTPIPYTGTFGTNGFNLQFENAAALGTDSSPNGNTFTPTNLTSLDQSTDYPEVNFATWNSLFRRGTITSTFTDGNLTSNFAGGAQQFSLTTFGVTTGKWYAEVKWISAHGNGATATGILDMAYTGTADPNNAVTNAFAYFGSGQKNVSGTASSYGASYGAGDIIGIALNCDNNQITFYKNGASQGVISIIAGVTYGIFGSEYDGRVASLNTGSPPYAISSGNADANGYGNFEYAVPSGYYSLNTKNLGEFG